MVKITMLMARWKMGIYKKIAHKVLIKNRTQSQNSVLPPRISVDGREFIPLLKKRNKTTISLYSKTFSLAVPLHLVLRQ